MYVCIFANNRVLQHDFQTINTGKDGIHVSNNKLEKEITGLIAVEKRA